MSSIAKVFVIINCILSVLFLGVAATFLAQHWDYKEMWLDTKYEYVAATSKLEEEKKQQEKYVGHLKTLLNERTTSLKQKQDELNKERSKNEKLEEWKEGVDAELKECNQNLKQYNQIIQEKEKENQALKAQKEEIEAQVRRDQEKVRMAYDELNAVTLELARYKGKQADTENMLKQASRELWESKQIVRTIKESGINIGAIVSKVPPLEAHIAAVSSYQPIVMISIGEDRQVEKGYQFTVYRGDKYIGQVVVEEVYSDMSAARINKQMTKRAIKKGDKVTTKFGGSF